MILKIGRGLANALKINSSGFEANQTGDNMKYLVIMKNEFNNFCIGIEEEKEGCYRLFGGGSHWHDVVKWKFRKIDKEKLIELLDENVSFEQYLQDKHAAQYQGLDDEMPDNFSEWLEDMGPDEMIEYAEKWHKV